MTHRATAAEGKRTRFKIFGEVIGELKKVVWLSRKDALYLAGVVLLVSIVASIVLGALDYAFARLIRDVLLGR